MPSASPHLRIGEAASRSGVSAANIRYYEKEGLLGAEQRADNGYRLYSADDVHRLRFIRMCRAMDMSLDEVRALLSLDLRSKADCSAACEVLNAHLGHVRERIAELQSLEQDLKTLRDRCDGQDSYCHTIEALHARADAQTAEGTSTQAGPRRHV
ncbi:Cd(II)/Pb(II)-responsive transcriptional regulator [Pseudacidovorax intermedius]|uniref:Cd(II)/Pb(II)-responsive transcriptional regulator n=1 Tax=Pseudacidovorax intermedius TaxID=433924 RepID=UPI0026F1710F|nr:Cd(II)/Pb(II)-responsive transcriptional regulator [Pseudacidovorax intermedius]